VRKQHRDRPVDEGGTPVGRRAVLGLLGLGAAGVVGGSHVQSALSRWLAPLEQNDPTGLLSLFPLGATFRYYSVAGSIPSRTRAAYRLAVTGLVEAPRTYRYADLAALPQTSFARDFQCVTGWRVPGVHWSGVRLKDLLDEVGVKAGARALTFTSFDGTYTDSLTLDQASRPDVLVALQMLGKPVSRDHGGPVRLYVAPMYGYKSVKWLGGIEVVDQVQPGFWERNGYDVDAWVGRSNGRDDKYTS
jgi:DMSO/TMAO reductase YedYZ molybdopterin-dependent catalytic subunit